MPTPLIAWGPAQEWNTPDGSHAWARQFELLPGSTMLNASVILTGVIGFEYAPAENMILWGTAETPTDALAPYQDDLIASYCERECEEEDFIVS